MASWKPACDLLPILWMNMTDEGLPAPLGLRDRFAVPETSVVAERSTRCVTGEVEVPVSDLAGFQRKLQSRLGLFDEDLFRYVHQDGSREGTRPCWFRPPLHPDSLTVVLAAKFEDDAARFIAATYGRKGVAQASEVLGVSATNVLPNVPRTSAASTPKSVIAARLARMKRESRPSWSIRNRGLIEEVAELLAQPVVFLHQLAHGIKGGRPVPLA